MLFSFLLALHAGLCAQETPPQMTAPLATGINDLHDQFVESIDDIQKLKVIDRIARTAPEGTKDVQALFDLFMRFSQTQVRDAVLSSLEKTRAQDQDLDMLLVHYLQQPEPEAKLFAIKGAVRVRDAQALPLIEELANKKFPYRSADDAVLLSDKNSWWVQYEALAALAQWKGEEVLPLLIKKTSQAPEVARLMGRFIWKQSLPTLLKWAAGAAQLDKDRARAGLAAPAPALELRETRADMLAVLRDPKAPREARHQLSIKVGICSTHEEMEELLKEYGTLKSDEDKLMYKAALFASRDKIAIPLLIETMKFDPKAANRSGALEELEDLLPPKEQKPLLHWSAQNDPDPTNRDLAERDLLALPR